VDSTPLEAHPREAFPDELPEQLARGLAAAHGRDFLTLSLRARNFPGTPGLPAEGPALWWGRTSDARYRVGAGTAREIEAGGVRRFKELADAHRELRQNWHAAGLDGSPSSRAAFLGFAFSPDPGDGGLPNALLSVPRVLVERRGNATVMHFNGAGDEDHDWLLGEWTRIARELFATAWPDSLAMDPAPRHAPDGVLPAEDPDWAARVRHALAAIEQPPLEKLVLTRRVELPLRAQPSLARILEWLAGRYPEAAVFAVRRPGVSLVGASPERLLGLEHGLVVADALAGSAPRATCDDADQLLGGNLLGDPKELAEHAVVVREILSALEPLCTALVASHSPSLLRLPNVQHLASHVHGRVKPDVERVRVAGAHASHAGRRRRPPRRRPGLAATARRDGSRLVHGRRRLAGRRRRRRLGGAALRSIARQRSEPLCRGRHRRRLRPAAGAARDGLEAAGHARGADR
jgi:isochorismate synthase EntC